MAERIPCYQVKDYSPGRLIMKGRDVKLEPSSHKGIFVGRIIGPETGFNHAILTMDLHQIPPGAHTGAHQHDETILHVISGKGYSTIDDVKYEWETGDTIHIKPGAWHQHWNPSPDAASMIAAKSSSLLNYLKPTSIQEKEDAIMSVDDSYIPDQPFGLGKLEVIDKNSPQWKNSWAVFETERREEWIQRMKASKTLMKGKDIRWEVGGHRGEFNARIIDSGLGFDSRLIDVGLQLIPPGGRNETHIHDEAMVFILAGKGQVVVNGTPYEVERGDCIFVHFGCWHQFRNTHPSEPFIQMRFINPVLKQYLFPFPWTEAEEASGSTVEADYVPKLPW